MPEYTVRIALRDDLDTDDWSFLRNHMKAIGFSKQISRNGKTFKLPSGLYQGTFNGGANELRSTIQAAIKHLNPEEGIVIAGKILDFVGLKPSDEDSNFELTSDSSEVDLDSDFDLEQL